MSDAKLEFVPVHRFVTIEFPDKQRYQLRVNFAVMTFFAVAEICREFNIRHPEEMSLMVSPTERENYVKLTGWAKKGRKVRLPATRQRGTRPGNCVVVGSVCVMGEAGGGGWFGVSVCRFSWALDS